MRRETKNQLKLAFGLAAITSLVVLAVGLAPIAAIAIPLSVFAFVFLSLKTITHFLEKRRARSPGRVIRRIVDLRHLVGSTLKQESEMTDRIYKTVHENIEANLKSCAPNKNTSDITAIIMDYYHDTSWDAWPSKKLAQEQYEKKQAAKTEQAAHLEAQRQKTAEPAAVVVQESVAENSEVRIAAKPGG